MTFVLFQQLRDILILTGCLHLSCFFPVCARFQRPLHPVWRALPQEAAASLWSAWTILQPAAKLQLNWPCGNNWKRLSLRSPRPSPQHQSLTSCPLPPIMSSSTWWGWRKWYRICWIPSTEVCRCLFWWILLIYQAKSQTLSHSCFYIAKNCCFSLLNRRVNLISSGLDCWLDKISHFLTSPSASVNYDRHCVRNLCKVRTSVHRIFFVKLNWHHMSSSVCFQSVHLGFPSLSTQERQV